MERQHHCSHAFTLIELLIVVAIIGILAAIAVPNFLNARARAGVASAQATMTNMATALDAYRIDHNYYPPDFDEAGAPSGLSWTSELLFRLTTPIAYMAAIPDDPFETKKVIAWPERYVGQHWFIYSMENNVGKHTETSITFGIDKSAYWVLLSVGPDLLMNGNANGVNDVHYIYQASNGVISNGDVVRSQASGVVHGNTLPGGTPPRQ